MTISRCWLLSLVVAFVVAAGGRASALVPGGGPKKSDCYTEWQVTTQGLTANHGRVGVDCQDGDPACDVDAKVDNTCTIGVSVCVFQTEAGCTPQEVTGVTLSKKAQALGIQLPALPASAPACGPATVLTLPLKQAKNGKLKPSKPITLKLAATSSGKPRKDADTLVLRCVPNRGAGKCPANASGGASEAILSVPRSGTDLDNGWTGVSHNFPVDYGTVLRACVTGCDASTNPSCTGDDAATNSVNGATFGAPLPLFTAGIPVCIVNRFGNPKVTGMTANLQTGAIVGTVNLLSDIYLTTATALCPRCSGNDLGKAGTCDGGAHQGQACVTDGIVTVTTAPVANKTFMLSSDCPPSGSPAGTLTIALPATTGNSSLSGPRPCSAAQDDNCNGSGCNATCTGSACVGTTPDGQCIDVKGGVSQLCCAGNTQQPCFPTAGGGSIVRTGMATVPVPAWPDPTYPKTGDAALVATFCEGASGSNVVNTATGLPGPGALILPVSVQWVK